MATYSLLDTAGVVQHHLVADSPADLGVYNELFEAVDTTNLNPQPSIGWKRVNGVFQPKNADQALSAWKGVGFEDPNVIEVEETSSGLRGLFGGNK